MPSTFTTNTGIEKIADGEQTGLWGDTTNLNFDIVDRALNGSVEIALSGTTHTLTTSSGVLSDGQFAVLVFTGSPSGTNTVTIAPNTAQKTYFVTNSTTQTVVLSQGSGANVSIPAGLSKIVFSNGAGAGAAVFDITNTLSGTFTGSLTGNVTGNAGTATALQTARTIGGVSFNGTANINLPGVNIAGNQNTTGNAATATALQTDRTINGVSFNGTANITLPTVNTSGDQTIAGTKTFSSAVVLSTAGTTTTQAVRADRTITSGTGILGGGNLTANRTLSIDIASQAEAEAGTDNAHVMTPLRTAQAIAALQGNPITQTFTASGTWTKPAGVKHVFVECWGGGAGGASAHRASGERAAGGGSGGTYVYRLIDASTIGATVTVTIGAGGGSRTGGTQVGLAGGDSSFGSFVVAKGGGGGTAQTTALGGGASATGGDAGYYSGSGVGGAVNGNGGSSVGTGGNSVYGGGGGGGAGGSTHAGGVSVYGGNGGASGVNGENGSIPGGGGGACTGTTVDRTSGAGARGEVRVYAW